MSSRESIITEINHVSETSERIGYLTCAVAELTKKLESHMGTMERDHRDRKKNFDDYKVTVDKEIEGVCEKVDAVNEDVKEVKNDIVKLKKYILVISALVGLTSSLIDRLDAAQLKIIFDVVMKLLA